MNNVHDPKLNLPTPEQQNISREVNARLAETHSDAAIADRVAAIEAASKKTPDDGPTFLPGVIALIVEEKRKRRGY